MKKDSVESLPIDNDPTATEELCKLLKDTLASSDTKNLIASLKSNKISLVLSGGGGKGAYQAGVILALYDCGIKNFLSISGTSVGGLNAALFHELCRLSNREIVLSIWNNMTYKSVMKFKFPIKLLLYALQSMSIFSINTPKIMQGMASTVDTDAEIDSVTDFLERLIILACGCCILFIVGGLSLAFFLFSVQPFLISTFGLTSNIIFVFPFIFTLILPKLAKIIGRKLALFSNAPLRESIENLDIDAICNGNPPVICTLAEQGSSNIFIPFYVPLNNLQPQQAVNILLQTAAIPEIFQAQNIFGRRFVDGGMADNVPIFGVFPQKPDMLFVVYLDHRFARINDLSLWERLRLNSIALNLDSNGNDEKMDWVRKTKIISIIPSKSLGGIFCGTLNFLNSKARKLIALGYKDTLQQLTKAANI